jgi:hypothetical protein
MTAEVVLICYFVLSEKTTAEKIEEKSGAHSGAQPCVFLTAIRHSSQVKKIISIVIDELIRFR